MEYIDFDDNPSNEQIARAGSIRNGRGGCQTNTGRSGGGPERDGLIRTPERIARMYAELLAGYTMDPGKLVNEALFDVKYDEMVIVRDIEFYSLCEHHMLPFIGRVHVAYIPNGKVIGLSKIPRIRGHVFPPVAGAGTDDPPDRRLYPLLHPQGWRWW